MANRPLPNVDPDALSKLASQYPGSGDRRAEPKLGGGGGSGSGGSSGGGSGGGGSSGGDDKRPPAKPAVDVKPQSGNAPVGRTAAYFTVFFTIIALAAAVAALAAPSLRTEARTLLQRYVPQMQSSWVDFITGHDTRRLEVTYEGLDQRVSRLTDALERIVAAPGVDPATARELLLKTEQNQRLAAAEAAVAAQKDALAALSGRTDSAEQKIAGLDEVRQSISALSDRTGAVEQSVTDLRGKIEAIEGKLAALQDADGKTVALIDGLAGQIEGVVAEIAKAHQQLEPVSALAHQVAEQRKTMELPLIGMTQLRIALNRDTPFNNELKLAKQLVGDDAEAAAALAALDSHAGKGVTTLRSLRRDFSFVATQMGGSLTRMWSWTQRVSSWVEVLMGARSVPEADAIGEVSSAIASIDAALEAGQLDLAIEEAATLNMNTRQSDVLLDGWIVEARRRLATERAFDRLSARIYARIGTPG